MARMLAETEMDAQIRRAVARAKRRRHAQPIASAARYDRRRRALVVTLTNGAELSVPIDIVPALCGATDAQLSTIRVGPEGLYVIWDPLNIDVGVAALAQAALGRNTLLRAAGAAGGSTSTTAKAVAARRNGLKGGRPRKSV